jgi:hypothetical protein
MSFRAVGIAVRFRALRAAKPTEAGRLHPLLEPGAEHLGNERHGQRVVALRTCRLPSAPLARRRPTPRRQQRSTARSSPLRWRARTPPHRRGAGREDREAHAQLLERPEALRALDLDGRVYAAVDAVELVDEEVGVAQREILEDLALRLRVDAVEYRGRGTRAAPRGACRARSAGAPGACAPSPASRRNASPRRASEPGASSARPPSRCGRGRRRSGS